MPTHFRLNSCSVDHTQTITCCSALSIIAFFDVDGVSHTHTQKLFANDIIPCPSHNQQPMVVTVADELPFVIPPADHNQRL